MGGMGGMDTGGGLSAQASGLRFAVVSTSVPARRAARFRFQIVAANGTPVTTFEPDQTKLMHFYLVRSDLTGFQHVHPTLSAKGMWTASLAPAEPGHYRAYVSFIAKDAMGKPVSPVLSRPVTIPGTAPARPLPKASRSMTVDGYLLTVAREPMAGMGHTLIVTLRGNGKPRIELQPYLGTYAHLTAFHAGDMAFTHLHPDGMVPDGNGGSRLTFHTMFPSKGAYRLFIQFRTHDRVHTAALTLAVH
jgi:hypothetical protein